MKSLIDLLQSVLLDIQEDTGIPTKRDRDYIASRTEDEGLGALALALGSFADDFERSIDEGSITPERFQGFKKIPGKATPIPAFLSGMMLRVFSTDGTMHEQVDPRMIKHIRQVCRMFKKILVPPKPAKVEACLDKFVENELALRGLKARIGMFSDIDLFDVISRIVWTRLDLLEPGVPRHGPGAVAERLSQNQKYDFTYWHTRLQQWFPADNYIVSRPDLIQDHCYKELGPVQEQPVRVVTVPKTQKGPRVIAIEPVAMQYVQQALLLTTADYLERRHPLTRRAIRFSDQSHNARRALRASKVRSEATLDLSDASDLVSATVVSRMLASCPNFRAMVFACRSHSADVPNRGTLRLRKFASMGSALCFPVESMVFYTLLLMAGHLVEHKIPSERTIRSMSHHIAVYGDDLICPVEWVPTVLRLMAVFGLKVNTAKSFWTGMFRESCGVDAFDGIDVTPVYVRRLRPERWRDTSATISWVAMANQLWQKGYRRAANYAAARVLEITPKSNKAVIPDTLTPIRLLPGEEHDARGTLRFEFPIYDRVQPEMRTRWHTAWQSHMVYCYAVVTRPVLDPLDGSGILLKAVLTQARRYNVRGTFLEQIAALPVFQDLLYSQSSETLTIKSRWCHVC